MGEEEGDLPYMYSHDALSHLSPSIFQEGRFRSKKESPRQQKLSKEKNAHYLNNESSDSYISGENRAQNASPVCDDSHTRDSVGDASPADDFSTKTHEEGNREWDRDKVNATIQTEQQGAGEQEQDQQNESISMVPIENSSGEPGIFMSPQRISNDGAFVDGQVIAGMRSIGESHGGSALSPIPLSHEIKQDISPGLLVRGTLHENGNVSIDGEEILDNNGDDFGGGDASLESSEDSNYPRSVLNDSVTSTGSLREEEIMKTREELGATSHAFIERLRGAAHRRKMNLARSRDDLAAKEREQREAIAASKARQSEPVRVIVPERRKTMPGRPEPTVATFKARPLPETNGWQGSAGLYGVPKIEKKKVTTPFSPLLGARRQLRKMIGKADSSKPARTESTEDTPNQFHARPLPKFTSNLIKAGQWGLPKVAKRPVTVPQSPLLGPRRKQQSAPANTNSSLGAILDCSAETTNKSATSDMRSVPSTTGGSVLSQSSQALLGLDVLSCKGKENDSANAEMMMTPPISTDEPNGDDVGKSIGTGYGYQPHSTLRAQQRAAFESQRAALEHERKEQERIERQKQVRALRRELGRLRESL